MKRGFTLVELAIVMTIIGLLIGGVLKGQQMIINARVVATINQINAFKVAHLAFKEKYNQLPGDYDRAYLRLAGCALAAGCREGDGDGDIGVFGAIQGGWYGEIQPFIWQERTQYWRHLALADLITGVAVDSTDAEPKWGVSHPAGHVSGGYQIAKIKDFAGVGTGSYAFRLQARTQAFDGNEVAARTASLIDRKMDDGGAATGDVLSITININQHCTTPRTGGNTYNNTSVEGCLMFFNFTE